MDIEFNELWYQCNFDDDVDVKNRLMTTYNNYPNKLLGLFKRYKKELNDYIIVSFGEPTGTDIQEVYIDERFRGNVVSIGDYRKILVLGSEVVDVSSLTYPLSTMMFLDTNITSYLRVILKKGVNRSDQNNVHTKTVELLESVDAMECQLNLFPYLYENSYKVKMNYIPEELFVENMQLAQVYADNMVIGLSKLKYEEGVLVGAEEYASKFKAFLATTYDEENYVSVKMIQAIIIKSFIIKNKSVGKLSDKTLELVNFVTNELGYHHEFLFILMIEYFNNNITLSKFFKTINHTKTPKLGEIEAMSFDLYLYDVVARHFFSYEKVDNQPYFVLPMLASFDNGFLNAIKSNPIKAVVVNKKKKTTSLICETRISDVLTTDELIRAYHGKGNSKQIARNTIDNRIDKLLKNLKLEYLGFWEE